MQKFFLKALLLIIGTSLCLNLLGTLAERSAPLEEWRVNFRQDIENLKVKKDLIKGITLGNSHADSINYSVLGIEGQSLALAAADLFEMEKIVLSLDDELPGLNTVFITISYYSFSRDNAKFESLRPRRMGFYSLIPGWSLIDGDWSNFFMGKLDAYTHVLSVVRSDNWKGVWPELIPGTPAANPFPYDGIKTSSAWGECLHYTAEQLDAHARETVGRNVNSSLQMAAAHPGLEKDSYAALARTIEHLQLRGTRVILYTPAYYDKYNLYFSEGGSAIIYQMKKSVKNLQKTYGVEYYNFSDDPQLIAYPELFYNSDHLSDCGGRVISEKLREQMDRTSASVK